MATEFKMGASRSIVMLDKLVDIEISYEGTSKTYQVHLGLLRAFSGYFDGAFRGNFREAHERRVCIEEMSHIHFEMFVEWLYFSRRPEPSKGFLGHPRRILEGEEKEALDRYMYDSVDLCIVSDRLIVPSLSEEIIDGLHEAFDISLRRPNPALIKRAFNGLPPSSPLCRLLVDVAAARICRQWMNDSAGEDRLSKDAYEALIRRMIERKIVPTGSHAIPGRDVYK